eukprot:m.83843 g.83843  ORF g.83843 m.83843 type:complete len:400 (-) comp13458_c3_seq4:1147-2346(-)
MLFLGTGDSAGGSPRRAGPGQGSDKAGSTCTRGCADAVGRALGHCAFTGPSTIDPAEGAGCAAAAHAIWGIDGIGGTQGRRAFALPLGAGPCQVADKALVAHTVGGTVAVSRAGVARINSAGNLTLGRGGAGDLSTKRRTQLCLSTHRTRLLDCKACGDAGLGSGGPRHSLVKSSCLGCNCIVRGRANRINLSSEIRAGGGDVSGKGLGNGNRACNLIVNGLVELPLGRHGTGLLKLQAASKTTLCLSGALHLIAHARSKAGLGAGGPLLLRRHTRANARLDSHGALHCRHQARSQRPISCLCCHHGGGNLLAEGRAGGGRGAGKKLLDFLGTRRLLCDGSRERDLGTRGPRDLLQQACLDAGLGGECALDCSSNAVGVGGLCHGCRRCLVAGLRDLGH